MARDLTAAAAAAANDGTVRPALFYEGVFSGGTLRLWSGIGPITWNGQTWTGAGQMLGVAAIGETSELRAVGFEVSLSGELSSLVSTALAQARQGLAGRVWLGFFDAAGALIADPFKAFEGRLDMPDVTDDGASARIAVKYESRLVDLDRRRERRYTSEDQALDYPDDRGFDEVPALQDAAVYWGRVMLQEGRPPVPAPLSSSLGGDGGAPY